VDAYGFDYPRRLFWSTWFDGSEAAHDVRRSLDREAIAHAQIDLHNVRTLILGSIESEPLAQLSDLDSRFVGHPIRHEVIKLLTPADALPEDPVEGLRAALEDESIKRVLVDETIPAWLSRRAADALRDSR
jgi:hypothetical protein